MANEQKNVYQEVVFAKFEVLTWHLLQGQRRTTHSVNCIGRSSGRVTNLGISNFRLEELFP